jgi:hypothetical protein
VLSQQPVGAVDHHFPHVVVVEEGSEGIGDSEAGSVAVFSV